MVNETSLTSNQFGPAYDFSSPHSYEGGLYKFEDGKIKSSSYAEKIVDDLITGKLTLPLSIDSFVYIYGAEPQEVDCPSIMIDISNIKSALNEYYVFSQDSSGQYHCVVKNIY